MQKKTNSRDSLRKDNGVMDNKMILSILKMRKDLHELYKKHNRMITLVTKGLSALLLFLSLNSLYQNHGAVMILLAVGMALICAVLPARYLFAASSLITAVHLWGISWDIALCYVVMVFTAWVFICRIWPDAGIIIAFAPLLFTIKIPFLLSLLVGLFAALSGVGALVFGVVFYFLGTYSSNAAALLSSGAGEDYMLAIQAVIASFAADKEFVLILGAMIIAALVVYILCHQSFDYSWYIGTVAGGIAGIVVYLAGAILFETDRTYIIYILTIPVAMCIACLVQFLRCIIDYSGVEYVEFQDDDYYYYVKAVPKVNVIVEDFALIEEAKKQMSHKEADEEKAEVKEEQEF